MDLVSVIVPVYNAAQYLPRCVESILCQSYQNLELILVDDGSSDKSLDICQEYARSDARVKVIRKENSGVSSARNCGMDAAAGEWISFVDADDYVLPGYLESFFLHSSGMSPDVICTGIAVNQNGKKKEMTYAVSAEKACGPNEIKKILNAMMDNNPRDLTEVNTGLMGYSVGKLYRRSAVGQFRFPVGIRIREDTLFNMAVLCTSSKISLIPGSDYIYVIRKSSAMSKYYADYSTEAQRFLDIMRSYCTAYDLSRTSYDVAVLFTYMNWIKRYALHSQSKRSLLENIAVIRSSFSVQTWQDSFSQAEGDSLSGPYRLLRRLYLKKSALGIIMLYYISKLRSLMEG